MGKKKPNKPIRFIKNGDDLFAQIYEGQIKSAAYKELSLGAKQFYIYCRVQAMSKQGKSCLYNHGKEYAAQYNDYCFVFPASHLRAYGIDRSNATRYFDELAAAGFIKKLECNAIRKKVNVYEFIDAWKNSS